MCTNPTPAVGRVGNGFHAARADRINPLQLELDFREPKDRLGKMAAARAAASALRAHPASLGAPAGLIRARRVGVNLRLSAELPSALPCASPRYVTAPTSAAISHTVWGQRLNNRQTQTVARVYPIETTLAPEHQSLARQASREKFQAANRAAAWPYCNRRWPVEFAMPNLDRTA